MVDQVPVILAVSINAGVTMLATSGKVPSDAESASGARSMPLKNQPSAVGVSNQTVESTSQTGSGSECVKHSSLQKIMVWSFG